MTDSTNTKPLTAARLEWDETGLPLSAQYDDIYFSKTSGLAESRYVFIEQNHLPQRFSELRPGQHFTIAETGFGSGLNFLASWQCWQENAHKEGRLHFISVEKHPMEKKDLVRALALWPQLESFANPLLQHYPPICPGFYRLHLAENVTLTLLFGEAASAFASLISQVDAWFLDGFAPAKNPEMWTPELFSSLAQHSHEDTSFSTFTAAGLVRRGLIDAGFKVKKVKGFGHKREMLCGQYAAAAPQSNPQLPGWMQLPNSSPSPQEVIVLGAGIAGCSMAKALAERGIRVRLIDRHPQVANEASGNPQGILYAKLPAKPTRASQIHLSGLIYSLQRLRHLSKDHWDDCGLLQLALTAAEQKKQEKLADQGNYPESLVRRVSAEQASDLAGTPLNAPGLWYPDSGWVSPADWCQSLVDHPLIELIADCAISSIQRDSDHWLLATAKEQKFRASHLVIACANQAKLFQNLDWLPLKAIRGQITQLPQQQPATLQTVLCGHSYLSPPHQQQWCFGATFNLHDATLDVREVDHQENLHNTAALAPQLAEVFQQIAGSERQGRVSFRCTSPDYLPLIGPVPDDADFIQRYGELRFDAKSQINQAPVYLPGLYVSLAHGSKGMITAPLAAELIASQLCNEPLPLPADLVKALMPARFLVKKLTQRAI